MIKEQIKRFKEELPPNVSLVAVSKTKPSAMIQEAYNAGQRIFGENRAQEMAKKAQELPKDIEWHMVGHLQTNKVKYIAPFVSLVHAVDSHNLLLEINKRAKKHERIIDCLVQIHIAEEESKHGILPVNVSQLLEKGKDMSNVNIVGLMGMATFTNDKQKIKEEFNNLKKCFDDHKTEFNLKTLSMGMSGDYPIAIEAGSNMVRIGSSIFGKR